MMVVGFTKDNRPPVFSLLFFGRIYRIIRIYDKFATFSPILPILSKPLYGPA